MAFGEEDDKNEDGAGEDLPEETDRPEPLAEEAGRGLHAPCDMYCSVVASD